MTMSMITQTSAYAPARYTATSNDTSGTPQTEPPVGAAEPSAPRTLPTNSKAMGRDEFLKMLVAQLKNQDPLNPMDGKDMAAQLAQFSTVEQLIQMNKSIEAQTGSNQAIADALTALQESQDSSSDMIAQLVEGQMAMGLVGKVGVTTGNTMFVDQGGKGTLLIDAGTSTGVGRVTVTDAKGTVVATADAGAITGGQQALRAEDLFNPPLPAGQYTYKVEVAKDGGPWQAVKTYTTGRITGLKYGNGSPILLIGDALSLPMSQLTQVRS